MKILVQHQGKTIHVELPDENTKVEGLNERLEAVTGIFKRHQKLIFKGKVLLPHQKFTEAKLNDGSKVMLMATSGPTLGQQAAEKLAKERAKAAQLKREKQAAQAERIAAYGQRATSNQSTAGMQERRGKTWNRTGIIALRDAGLQAVPPEVWETGMAAQVADLGGNQFETLPHELTQLSSLQRLRLSHNLLADGGILDGFFATFQRMQVLSISNNRFSHLPHGICQLPCLRILDVSQNLLELLPDSIGSLTSLQQLDLSTNLLTGLPSSIGSCHSLSGLNLTANRLEGLPLQLASLQQLQSLLVDRNRLRSIPGEVLRGCQALHTISAHGNNFTVEQLRGSADFKEFDDRRRAKYSKQLEMRVMGPSDGFDEGADAIKFSSWASTKRG